MHVHTNLSMNAPSHVIPKGQKLKAGQMFVSQHVDRQTYVAMESTPLLKGTKH